MQSDMLANGQPTVIVIVRVSLLQRSHPRHPLADFYSYPTAADRRGRVGV